MDDNDVLMEYSLMTGYHYQPVWDGDPKQHIVWTKNCHCDYQAKIASLGDYKIMRARNMVDGL